MTASDFTTPAEVRAVYRRRARFYNWTANAYYLLGFREWAYRRRAVEALGLRPGATVVEIGCGTGLNFRLLQDRIGSTGRLIGVDLTDAMLDQARELVAREGWRNVELVCSAAANYEVPSGVDGVLSAFALTLEPRFDEVIANVAHALAADARFVLLDLRLPDSWLRHFAPALIWLVRPFAVSMEVAQRRPWESVRRCFTNYRYERGYLGAVYIAVGQNSAAVAPPPS